MQNVAVVGSFACFPPSQARQAESPAWRERVLASSVMYRPEGQSLQSVEVELEYFPAMQMSHDSLGEKRINWVVCV